MENLDVSVETWHKDRLKNITLKSKKYKNRSLLVRAILEKAFLDIEKAVPDVYSY